MKSPARWLTLIVLAAAASLHLRAADAPPAAPDPIEGFWGGAAEQPGDPAGYAFEFKRNDQGELAMVFSNTTIQFLNNPGGTLRNDGHGVYTATASGRQFTLKDGELSGFVSPRKYPIHLHRIDAMPVKNKMPDYPAAPAPVWRSALGAAMYAAPAVADGVAYLGTTGGLFHAVNLKDGSFKWAFAAGRPIHGEALVDGAHVYFVCDNGYLFKLSRADGKEVWRYDLGDERVPRTLLHFLSFENDHYAPKPALADGVLFIGSGDGSMHAVNADSGQRVWRFAATGKIRKAAALAGANVVFGTVGGAEGYSPNSGTLYAVDRATGKLSWHYDLHGAATSSPVLVGDKLIVGNRGSTLVALDSATGALLWEKYYWGSWVEATPVPAGELFYLGSADLRCVRAYDPRDGSYRWSTYVFGWQWDRVAVTDQTVYAATGATELPGKPYYGSLFALDRATGRVKWRWAAPELPGVLFTGFASAAVVADQLVLAAGLDGTLYAFPSE